MKKPLPIGHLTRENIFKNKKISHTTIFFLKKNKNGK